jgi:type IV secretion system protein VirB6
MVDQHPFTSMDTDFGAAFTNGVNGSITSILSAIGGPLTATVTLWIIIQGVLVMRGDVDTRIGLTRILKVALVVGLLTSSGLFQTYVQSTFMTVLPNWVAQSAGGTGLAARSIPGTFDSLWSLTEHHIEGVAGELSPIDVFDAVSLAVIAIAIGIVLVVSFAVYEFSIIVTGILVAAGPILIIGYLFEATKGFTDRWIGSLVTYAILILLLRIALNIVVSGEVTYFKLILVQAVDGDASAVPAQIITLAELLMFMVMGGFIIISLPAIASGIGGGHGGGPGHAVMRLFTGGFQRVTQMVMGR